MAYKELLKHLSLSLFFFFLQHNSNVTNQGWWKYLVVHVKIAFSLLVCAAISQRKQLREHAHTHMHERVKVCAAPLCQEVKTM